MAVLPVAEWAPDLAPVNAPATMDIENVYPSQNGYKPWGQHETFTDALDARAQGAFAAKDDTANAVNFAGDASKLYKLSGGLWADVSRTSGGAYSTDPSEHWEFAQFGSNAITVNGTNAPQKFEVGTDSNFSELAGAPPTARHIAVVRDFVVLGNLANGATSLHWSGFNNSAQWTAGQNQSDTQIFPDGGWVQKIIGGEVGYIIQERSIRRMTYIGGDLVFQFDEIEKSRGTRAPQSVVQVGGTFFYLGQDGFYWFNGGQSQPIGTNKVNRWFEEQADSAAIYRVTGAADPKSRIVVWAFSSVDSADGTPDTLLGFKWDIGRWFKVRMDIDYLVQSIAQGLTLEELDTISTDVDALPFSLDSSQWAGGALALSAFSTDFKMGSFSGPPLEARICSQESELYGGRRAFVSAALPTIDTDQATVQIGTRARAADEIVFTDPTSMDVSGWCPAHVEARYICARVNVPEGASWKDCQGVTLAETVAGVI